MPPDVRVERAGTLFVFRLVSDAAHRWAAENIPEDAAWIGNAFVAEFRSAPAIATGMQDEGLVLE